MNSKPNTAAMIVMEIAVDPKIENEFNRSYDEIHLPEVCAPRGIGWVGRLRVSGAEGRYFTLYELSDPGAFETEAFRAWRADSRDTDAMMARFKEITRTHAIVISNHSAEG